MIARAPTRCGSRLVIHGGPRGDDQRVVAPGGFSNAHYSDALPGVGVAHLRKAGDHQIGMDIGSKRYSWLTQLRLLDTQTRVQHAMHSQTLHSPHY